MPTEQNILHLRQDLLSYWQPAHTRWDTLLDVYHGNYARLYPEEFRRGEIPKTANWIKLGWDRYATMVGKLPVNKVPPSGAKRITQNRADKIERILVSYDNNSSMTSVAKWYSWFLVGLGAAALGVMPDPMLKGPRIYTKDPRTVLVEPGAGSIPLTSTSYGMQSDPMMHAMSINRALVNETMTASAIIDSYGSIPGVEASLVDSEATSLMVPHNVITYMDRDVWTLMVNERIYAEIEHGLDIVPLRFTSMFVPEQLGGQSMFEQNIGLVLAYMRILNQKLVYNQNTVWPWLVLQGPHNMDAENRVIELIDTQGNAEFLSPPGELQVERDLDVLDRLIRLMNHDNEVAQGEAPSSLFTGAAADRLGADMRQQVLDRWDVMKPDYEFVKSAALAIDEKLYGGANKEIWGKTKGETFEDKYTPRKDIRGYRNVTVDYGIGVGGLEGFTELMQTAAQGFIDETSVMDAIPWIQSTSDTKRKVFLDRIERVIFEMVSGGAPVPVINHMTAWRDAVNNTNVDPYKWIAENPFPEPEPELGLPGAEGALAPPGGPAPPDVTAAPGVAGIPSPTQLLSLAQGRGQ